MMAWPACNWMAWTVLGVGLFVGSPAISEMTPLDPISISANSTKASGKPATRKLVKPSAGNLMPARADRDLRKLESAEKRLGRALKSKDLSKEELAAALTEVDEQIANAEALADRVRTKFSGSDQALNQMNQRLASILRALREMRRGAHGSGL